MIPTCAEVASLKLDAAHDHDDSWRLLALPFIIWIRKKKKRIQSLMITITKLRGGGRGTRAREFPIIWKCKTVYFDHCTLNIGIRHAHAHNELDSSELSVLFKQTTSRVTIYEILSY